MANNNHTILTAYCKECKLETKRTLCLEIESNDYFIEYY